MKVGRSGFFGTRGVAAAAILAFATMAGVEAQTRYKGPDGVDLPFATDAQVIDFLATADVVSVETAPVGTTKPLKVVLQKGGVRANAIFRDVRKHKDVGSWGFVDSYQSEIAAYQLAKLLGLDTVPPAVERKVKGKRGSVQLWIENAMTDADRRRQDIEPPDPERFAQQIAVLKVFDNLIANIDRNPGNILVGKDDWKVWFIDHTRSFAGQTELDEDYEITGCDRNLFQRLQSVRDDQIRDAVGKYARYYVGPLLERRKLVVAELNRLIAERGADAVLFDLGGS